MEFVPNLCLMAGHTFNVLNFMAGHLMRSETSRFSRETFRFSWNLSYFAETFRFSRNFSAFTKPFGFLMINGRPFNEKRDFSVFSWNLSSFAETFRFSQSFSFSQKPFVSRKVPSVFLPWLMAGHPLPINSQDHSSKWLTFFLRENPKIPEKKKKQELAGFLSRKFRKKKRVAERKAKRIVLFWFPFQTR